MTPSTVPGLGTTFGRGGATNFQQDLQIADCILIQGSAWWRPTRSGSAG